MRPLLIFSPHNLLVACFYRIRLWNTNFMRFFKTEGVETPIWRTILTCERQTRIDTLATCYIENR
ncbi:hypothetical protein BDV19DRAFT_374060 [Aspergillus venezuelensis]